MSWIETSQIPAGDEMTEVAVGNLILLCWWHHIFIHEKGWHITRGHDRRFLFRRRDWSPYPPRPT